MRGRRIGCRIIELTAPMPPPHWALLERELMRALAQACQAFFARYFDDRGYLLCVPRWGALDGPDDAAENVAGFTDFYALGGPQVILDLYRKGFEGHLRQYTEAKTTETPLGRDGMYYKEFPTSFDWVHNGEGFHCLFQQGLCEPWDTTYRRRMRRFAGFYMNEDPQAPNYDPQHKIIRSAMNGSRGPVLRRADPVDWAGDPFEVEGRFQPQRGHRNYDDYLAHFEIYRDVVGDIPLNLAATVLPLHAYLLDGEQKCRDWIVEYADAWVERTYANGGLIPGNIGLGGTIGGACDGKWWRGLYGWSHTGTVPRVTHRASFQLRTPYGFGNALLVTGDQKYVDVWRTVIDAVNANKKEENGETIYPRMYGDDGWYAYGPEPFDRGALEAYFWSMDRQDHALVAQDPWVAFLDGNNPSYPVERLQGGLAEVRRRMELMRNDTSTPDTRLSEDPNGINPAEEVWGLVQLMLGGLPTRHAGVPWHCRVRYFDPESRRAGIPEQVASLVDSMTADEVGVTLVNLDQTHPSTLILQGGAYAEHQIERVTVDGRTVPVDDSVITVHLAPGAGSRLSLTVRRYANQPTLAFPWER